jgi:hypothetical protein
MHMRIWILIQPFGECGLIQILVKSKFFSLKAILIVSIEFWLHSNLTIILGLKIVLCDVFYFLLIWDDWYKMGTGTVCYFVFIKSQHLFGFWKINQFLNVLPRS